MYEGEESPERRLERVASKDFCPVEHIINKKSAWFVLWVVLSSCVRDRKFLLFENCCQISFHSDHRIHDCGKDAETVSLFQAKIHSNVLHKDVMRDDTGAATSHL